MIEIVSERKGTHFYLILCLFLLSSLIPFFARSHFSRHQDLFLVITPL